MRLRPINPSIYQSINQSIDQSINQSINQNIMRLRANQSTNRTSATKSQADKIIERNFLFKQGSFLVRRYILGAKQLLQITCSVRPI